MSQRGRLGLMNYQAAVANTAFSPASEFANSAHRAVFEPNAAYFDIGGGDGFPLGFANGMRFLDCWNAPKTFLVDLEQTQCLFQRRG